MKSKQKCFKVILNMSVKIKSQFSAQAIINSLFLTASGIPMSQVIAPPKICPEEYRTLPWEFVQLFICHPSHSLTEPNFIGCEVLFLTFLVALACQNSAPDNLISVLTQTPREIYLSYLLLTTSSTLVEQSAF